MNAVPPRGRLHRAAARGRRDRVHGQRQIAGRDAKDDEETFGRKGSRARFESGARMSCAGSAGVSSSPTRASRHATRSSAAIGGRRPASGGRCSEGSPRSGRMSASVTRADPRVGGHRQDLPAHQPLPSNCSSSERGARAILATTFTRKAAGRDPRSGARAAGSEAARARRSSKELNKALGRRDLGVDRVQIALGAPGSAHARARYLPGAHHRLLLRSSDVGSLRSRSGASADMAASSSTGEDAELCRPRRCRTCSRGDRPQRRARSELLRGSGFGRAARRQRPRRRCSSTAEQSMRNRSSSRARADAWDRTRSRSGRVRR